MERFFDWFLLVALGCLACLGLGRAFMLAARGVRVVVIDLQRPTVEIVTGLLVGSCFCLWVYEIVAYAWPLATNIIPQSLGTVIVHATGFKLVGTGLMIIGLLMYGIALWSFGTSWRLGIDRDAPGVLVMGGIFARTRNPIYLSLDLLAIGTFLIQGILIFLLFTFVFVGMLHILIRLEERFLAETYGKDYRDYCARVRRYV